MNIDNHCSFLLGDWIVDPATCQLLRDGFEVKIEPRMMAVLVYLARNQGKVICREELENTAWEGMVVGYSALSSSIIKLRKALEDSSSNPSYIKTIPKKGYQLIAPLSVIDNTSNEFSQIGTDLQKQSLRTGLLKGKRALFLGLGALVMLSVLFIVWLVQDKTELPISSLESRPFIMVLPFKNLSDDTRQKYISEGVTDDLITDLSSLSVVRVMARQSSDYYQQNENWLKKIKREQTVLYVVKGSVRKSGDNIRINVQLINTKQAQNTWAERFDVPIKQVFSVQDKITRHIIKALSIRPTTSESISLSSEATKSFEAYRAFQMGQQFIKMRSSQGFHQAMNAYQQAIEIDPGYARAYGAMAVAITRGYRYQWTELSLVEARERALQIVNTAITLNKVSPQVYWSKGYVHLHRREFDLAEEAIKRSITLSPNYADAYALLANVANWRGKPREAVENIKKATELNPYYSFQYSSTLGLALYSLARYEKAIVVLHDAIERNVNALNPRLFLAATYVRLGRLEDASWEIKQIYAAHPDVSLSKIVTILPFEKHKIVEVMIEDLRKASLRE